MKTGEQLAIHYLSLLYNEENKKTKNTPVPERTTYLIHHIDLWLIIHLCVLLRYILMLTLLFRISERKYHRRIHEAAAKLTNVEEGKLYGCC